MTASAYLKWCARLYGASSTKREIGRLLTKVGLGRVAHHPVGSYSRGMKQRLAVARALVPHPRLLILDEPTNGLDPKGRREIHDLLADFVIDGKTGVLLCTHLLDDVDRLCNRIGIIDQGGTRIEGALDELLAERAGERRYRLRLESEPDNAASLPGGVAVLGRDGDWWRIQCTSQPSAGPSAIWRELWRRGWKIAEIHADASSVEELYMAYIAPYKSTLQEALK